MKRAILVSAGTLAGLAAVLSYSAGDVPVSIASDVPGGTGSVAGLGGPAPDASASAKPKPSASGAKPAPKPSGSPKASPSAAPSSAAPSSGAPTPAASSSAPKPAASPTPKPSSAKPTPKPTPTPTKAAGPQTFIGPSVTNKYGTTQVGIKVQGGKIIDAWAVKYPDGASQPYSEFAIPQLRQHTIGATSANIASVSGATLTSQAWKSSLASALSKAGL